MVYSKESFNLRPLGRILDDEEPGDDDIVASFWLQNQVFISERHREIIEPCKTVTQTWRMKERMKTVSVALVLCLNIGVDPPDVVKISPCARLQCWIDPIQFGDPCNSAGGQKPIEVIGTALQKQYERWQPRARYKLSLDPTVDDVKKLCTSLRRNAKDERVLFHYNGHGVPRPTGNGEVWVFNKHYTQYIPLSVCDLHLWMGSPSIYVFDCSNAGNVVDCLKNPPTHLYRETENEGDHFVEHESVEDVMSRVEMSGPLSTAGSCIILAACKTDETLPLNPNLPADLFTSCLTTPIKVALKWYVLSRTSKLVPNFTADMVDQIPGQLNDRRTMLGELNWIFTAITDTIAWNVLSRELFQKLFRQDLLVASLFRNFLLAERILDFYNCNPISVPRLPPTRHHFMWLAWDYALDGVLKQLPNVIENSSSFQHSPFFSDQLTGFEVWLKSAISLGIDDQVWNQGNIGPPEQLPIVLQVLLSQVHRQRALELLGKFLNLGQWAVNLALSVGIFPYVLKLLQSSSQELKSLLVFIWAKLLAVDSSCQADLVKDNGHKYFLDVLADSVMEAETRMTAAFVLAMMVDNYGTGQVVAVKNNIISVCLVQVTDLHPGLRQWVVLCLGKVWWKYDEARWRGVRDTAHEKLFPLLQDPIPEVRASTAYCLGTFLSNSTERGDQVNKIDNAVANSLLQIVYDGSPIVRKELVIALSGFVANFSAQFEKIASESLQQKSYYTVTGQDALSPKNRPFKLPRSNSASDLTVDPLSENCSLKHISSVSPIHGMRSNNVPHNVWNALLNLKNDPHPMVSRAASQLCDEVLQQSSKRFQPYQNRLLHQGRRDSGNLNSSVFSSRRNTVTDEPLSLSLTSNFFSWCCRQFAEPTTKVVTSSREDGILSGSEEVRTIKDERPGSARWYNRDYRYNRAARVIISSEKERQKAKTGRLDESVMSNKFTDSVGILKFHPYEPYLTIVEETSINIWDWEQGRQIATFSNRNLSHARTTHINFLNVHDETLLLSGTDDGYVRIWKNYASDNQLELITSWTVLNNLIPMSNSPGLVMEWDETNQLLFACGNAAYIRLWDINTELKLRDMPLASNSCTTSLSLDTFNRNLFVGGFGDGSVRVFDKRLSRDECQVRCLREHSARIHKVCCPQGFENLLISASNQGDLCFWDLRNAMLLRSVQTTQSPSELKAFDVHHRAEVLVCSHSGQQNLSAYNYAGEWSYQIKCHQGFMSQKIGISTYLAFHPHKVFVTLFFVLITSVVVIFYSCLLPLKLEEGVHWALFHLVFGHWLLISVVFNYIKASFTDPGCPHSNLSHVATICKKCLQPKPQRAHHCRVCNRCILKMDHHCPWLNNCVGHYNHRYFFMFCVFMHVGCSYVSICAYPLFKKHFYGSKDVGWLGMFYPFYLVKNYFWPDNEWHLQHIPQKLNSIISYHGLIVFEFLLCSTACMALTGLVVWHFRLISKGETSVEMHANFVEKKRLKSVGQKFVGPYDYGFVKNWKLFLGLTHGRTFWKHILCPSSHQPYNDGTHWEPCSLQPATATYLDI